MGKKSTKRVTRKPSQHKKTSKKKFLFWQRGEIAIYLLLGIIILGAFLIVSGGPSFNLSKVDTTPAGEIVPEPTDIQRDNLQLKTIKFQACGNNTGAYFIVDTSGSMRDNNKMQNVKDALQSFASNLTDKSVVGMRRYSSDLACSIYGRQVTSLLVPIGFYGTNKNTFSQATSALCPSGSTNTSAAFAGALNDLRSAVTNPAYKDTPLNVIFISDGIPEGDGVGIPQTLGTCSSFTSARYPICAPYTSQGRTTCRCFDSSQDPTANPSIAQQIQALKNINGKNVRVFSVLVFSQATDGPFKANLDNMMKTIASPGDYYQTSRPEDIKGIYEQIANKICASNGNPTPTP